MKITRQTQKELKTHLDNYKETPNRELTETHSIPVKGGEVRIESDGSQVHIHFYDDNRNERFIGAEEIYRYLYETLGFELQTPKEPETVFNTDTHKSYQINFDLLD